MGIILRLRQDKALKPGAACARTAFSENKLGLDEWHNCQINQRSLEVHIEQKIGAFEVDLAKTGSFEG